MTTLVLKWNLTKCNYKNNMERGLIAVNFIGVPISPYTLNDQYQTVQLLNSAMIMLQAIDTTKSNSSTTYTSTSTTDYMPSTTTSTLQSTMTLSESSLASWIPIVGANTSQAMHTSRASIWTVSMYMIAVWIIANMIG